MALKSDAQSIRCHTGRRAECRVFPKDPKAGHITKSRHISDRARDVGIRGVDSERGKSDQAAMALTRSRSSMISR